MRAWFGLVFIVACGGDPPSSVQDASTLDAPASDADARTDASSDAGPLIVNFDAGPFAAENFGCGGCPKLPPTEGAPCPKGSSNQCEYGPCVDFNDNVRVDCELGLWHFYKTSLSPCREVPPCSGLPPRPRLGCDCITDTFCPQQDLPCSVGCNTRLWGFCAAGP